jgi:hypothetical protein
MATGFLLRLDEPTVPDAATLAAWREDDVRCFDLEAAVAGVAYLLGDAGAFLAMHEGTPLRAMAAAEVAALATTIESLRAGQVRARLDAAELTRITPFRGPLGDEDKEWLLAVLQGVMVFVRRAADDGVAILPVVTADDAPG